MRKRVLTIDEIKANVAALVGKPIRISVNKGRKKILRYCGCVLRVYPQVFTMQISGDSDLELLACSYNDLICGDVKIVQNG